LGQSIDFGTVRELFFVQSTGNAGLETRLSGASGDFQIRGNLFEVGGANKRRKQLPGDSDNEFVVKDGILLGSCRTIPLYLIGFLY
jgi:hypothetical protein